MPRRWLRAAAPMRLRSTASSILRRRRSSSPANSRTSGLRARTSTICGVSRFEARDRYVVDYAEQSRAPMWQRIRSWARQLKAETIALWFCCRHPATPLAAKILATVVVAYALSPIDLIPDFIPVIGYLDDVILIPIGIY